MATLIQMLLWEMTSDNIDKVIERWESELEDEKISKPRKKKLEVGIQVLKEELHRRYSRRD